MSWTRRAFWTAILGGLATGAYAGVVEPIMRFHVKRYAIRPKSWPEGYRLKIAAIADPHVNRPFMTPAHMAHVVETVHQEQPDIVVMLGDYISSIRGFEHNVTMDEIAACFAPLRAPLGVHAILGNHDWWDDPGKATQRGTGTTQVGLALEAHGIRVLENDVLRIDHDGGAFWLIGLGDQWAFRVGRDRFEGRDDLPGSLARVTDDAPVILLAHEPDIFPDVPDRVSLTLSGHTHGGQVRLLNWAPYVPSRFGNRYSYGHIVEEDRDLVVSSGVGCSVLPLRFGIPPELTIVELG